MPPKHNSCELRVAWATKNFFFKNFFGWIFFHRFLTKLKKHIINFVKNLWKRIQPKKVKNKKVLLAQATLSSQEFYFWGITPKPKIRIL
jgi:hypothetical protein